MSKVRNATDGRRHPPLLDYRPVEPGEEVEVPDFQSGHTDETPRLITWPPPTWDYVRDDRPVSRDDGDSGTPAAGSGEGNFGSPDSGTGDESASDSEDGI